MMDAGYTNSVRLFSLPWTPLMVALNYLIARKEEEMPVREFGRECPEYRRRAPTFIPA